MSGVRIGIDLGTTYSLAAAVVDGEPRILPNALGETLTPSAIHVDEAGNVLVGSAARARAATHPERTALAFKRDMGTDKTYTLGSKSFRPEELSALVLSAVRQDAEAALGQPISEAVVTVPAYFGELQRRATHQAAELAELKVERMINEPTAAALAYGLHQQHREFRAVVMDLGGGTFDVTVLEILEEAIEIQASAGDARLGGEDFLDVVVEHCVALFGRQGVELGQTPVAKARLREACERAKRQLSVEDRARIALAALPTAAGDRDLELTLDRSTIDELYRPLLERMMSPIQRALRDAKQQHGQIDEVLLVGGATRMPCVVRLAAQLFGRLPLRTLPPDEAIALGAAVQVALKAGDAAVGDIVVTDVAPFTLGIATSTETSGAIVNGLYAPILERGTVLPASRVHRFATMGDGQERIEIDVYQGEHSLCAENQKIGSYTLKGIPRRPAGEETVDVRFSYDMNGVLEVDATIVSTKKTASFSIERTPGRLTEKELEETRQRLRRLKFHPREALPNLTALNRAEALYVELSGPERALLGDTIARFRSALEAQDPALIVPLREALLSRILQLGSS